MKAVVIYQKGDLPQYTEDFPDPVARDENETVISVKAAAIKHLDRSRSSGKHYTARGDLSSAKIIGGDGVGILPDGTRVFALGNGMLAEKAVVEKDRIIKVPKGLDDATAAALPNAVAGSAMALRFRARMKKGETVFINGATGFTGKIAVQVARYYGAQKIIATGRNEETLQALRTLGADEIISLKQDDESLVAQIKRIHRATPIDIIIDYLWGHTAELILSSLAGQGGYTHRTRFVSIGSVTGDKIQLSAEILRSVDLQLSGSGLGSWTRNELKELFRVIVPKMFRLAASRQLKADIRTIELADIEKLWDMDMPDGVRLVATL